MEIKDFISNTIEQISEGVRDAHSKCCHYGTIVNPSVGDGGANDYYVGVQGKKWRVQTLDMDIAVTVTETADRGMGGKIGIASFGVGVNKEKGYSTANESRIRFSIPICLPTAREF